MGTTYPLNGVMTASYSDEPMNQTIAIATNDKTITATQTRVSRSVDSFLKKGWASRKGRLSAIAYATAPLSTGEISR